MRVSLSVVSFKIYIGLRRLRYTQDQCKNIGSVQSKCAFNDEHPDYDIPVEQTRLPGAIWMIV